MTMTTLQTGTGKDAAGLVKEEVQLWFTHFLHPYIQKMMAEEVQQNPHFAAIHQEWKDTVQRTYDAGVDRKWTPPPRVPLVHYQPNDYCCLLTMDNCPSHSMWAVYNQEFRFCGISLLCLLRMPPNGHDLHQIPEHAIGCIKGHVGRQLAEWCTTGRDVTCEDVVNWVDQGTQLYGLAAIQANMLRLRHCLRLITADRDTLVTVVIKDQVKVLRGLKGRYAPQGLN